MFSSKGNQFIQKVFMKDYAPIFRDELEEFRAYNELKQKFSDKVFQLNELKIVGLAKLQKAIKKYHKQTHKYSSLAKELGVING